MKRCISIIAIFFVVIYPSIIAEAREPHITDYLILNDIGDYKFITRTKDFITGEPKTIKGYTRRMSSGSLVGTGHFDLDHDDITYETDYLNRKIKVAVDVQVTQHVGADSDRWLLHEMEDAFRDPDNLEESPAEATLIRQLFGNRIFFYGGGIVAYRWPSSSTVVNIQYSNFTGPKPEPLEIVQAYLKKFPSTLRPTLILGKTHDQEWIKSEMERRLWLCKKWFQHYQAGKVKLSVALHEVAAHAEIFLNYREKYYKKKADKDIRALSEYLYSSDATNINNRLESYTRWWNANKHRIIKVR